MYTILPIESCRYTKTPGLWRINFLIMVEVSQLILTIHLLTKCLCVQENVFFKPLHTYQMTRDPFHNTRTLDPGAMNFIIVVQLPVRCLVFKKNFKGFLHIQYMATRAILQKNPFSQDCKFHYFGRDFLAHHILVLSLFAECQVVKMRIFKESFKIDYMII